MTDTIKVQVHGNDRPKFVWYPSVVQALASERVMTIEVEEGEFVLTEGCDGCFTVRVDRETLTCLGEELIAMAKGGS